MSTHIRTSNARAESLLAGQKRALELAVDGAPLRYVLDALALALESNLERRTFVSVLLVDRDRKHLRHGAAPSLPEAYNRAIDGIEIGADMGSCGTAAFRKTPVIVSDIQRDALWSAFRGLAQEHGLAACWSTPILSTTGAVLGTFALYYPTPERPSDSEREAVELLAHTAAIVIERDRSQEDLEASAERYRLVSEAARDDRAQGGPMGGCCSPRSRPAQRPHSPASDDRRAPCSRQPCRTASPPRIGAVPVAETGSPDLNVLANTSTSSLL